MWKVLQESPKGNRRRKGQNVGERGRRGGGFWPGKEGGVEVWRGFLLVAFSPDRCLLFGPLLLFTVLPAWLLSGLGSGLQWDWNNACVTFAFVTLSYMHKRTHTRRGSLMAHFPSCAALLEVYDHLSVLAKRLNKSFLSLSLSLCPLSLSLCNSLVLYVWVCTCVCVPTATCDLRGMKKTFHGVVCVCILWWN